MQPTIRHFIQRDIIRSLSRHNRQTFGELHPEGLENGIFGYHLKQLLSIGLIVKNDDRYSLSISGMRYVSIATRTNIDILPSPKIFCFLAIENNEGEFVMHRRNAAPFAGQYTFPGGSLFYGESTDELVERQLVEKVGFSVELEHKGIANLRHLVGTAIISHSYAHLYYGKICENPTVRSKDERFTPKWINPRALSHDEIVSDLREIIDIISSSKAFFYLELTKRDL